MGVIHAVGKYDLAKIMAKMLSESKPVKADDGSYRYSIDNRTYTSHAHPSLPEASDILRVALNHISGEGVAVSTSSDSLRAVPDGATSVGSRVVVHTSLDKIPLDALQQHITRLEDYSKQIEEGRRLNQKEGRLEYLGTLEAKPEKDRGK